MTEDPIDREVLGRLDFGEPPGQVLRMLLDTFLEHSPSTAAKLADAAAVGDAGGVQQAAHSLKSSVRQYGAMQLGDELEAIERGAGAGTVDRSAVDAALEGYEAVRLALTEVRANR